jgi:hypothetical protein
MQAPGVYLIFWLPPDRDFGFPSPDAASYQALITRYFSDVGDSDFYALLTEYSTARYPVSNALVLAGVATDSAPYPGPSDVSAPMNDLQIRAEINRVSAAHGWGLGSGMQVYVFTASDAVLCRMPSGGNGCTTGGEDGSCAWHGWLDSSEGPTPYAVLPEVMRIPGCDALSDTTATPNNNPAADIEISFASHEQFEMVTDPFNNGWRDIQGMEIADKCLGQYGPEDADGADVLLHGDPYQVQEEWSNRQQACVLRNPDQDLTPPAGFSADPTPRSSLTPVTSTPTLTIGPITQPHAAVTPRPTGTEITLPRGLIRWRLRCGVASPCRAHVVHR